jgi:hypothetical protein
MRNNDDSHCLNLTKKKGKSINKLKPILRKRKRYSKKGSNSMRQNKVSPGDWVILKDNRIIAHNRDMKIILEIANKYKNEDIIISKEPVTGYCFY